MEVVTILAVGFMCCACFLLGAKVGQTVKNEEPIELPTLNPFKAYQEHRNKQEAEFEQQRIDTIMRNIEGYDGTGNGQEDVPGR